jgi:hypothetical protein
MMVMIAHSVVQSNKWAGGLVQGGIGEIRWRIQRLRPATRFIQMLQALGKCTILTNHRYCPLFNSIFFRVFYPFVW